MNGQRGGHEPPGPPNQSGELCRNFQKVIYIHMCTFVLSFFKKGKNQQQPTDPPYSASDKVWHFSTKCVTLANIATRSIDRVGVNGVPSVCTCTSKAEVILDREVEIKGTIPNQGPQGHQMVNYSLNCTRQKFAKTIYRSLYKCQNWKTEHR